MVKGETRCRNILENGCLKNHQNRAKEIQALRSKVARLPEYNVLMNFALLADNSATKLCANNKVTGVKVTDKQGPKIWYKKFDSKMININPQDVL